MDPPPLTIGVAPEVTRVVIWPVIVPPVSAKLPAAVPVVLPPEVMFVPDTAPEAATKPDTFRPEAPLKLKLVPS